MQNIEEQKKKKSFPSLKINEFISTNNKPKLNKPVFQIKNKEENSNNYDNINNINFDEDKNIDIEINKNSINRSNNALNKS